MTISATRGVALYVGALLGPGLLVLPGLAAAAAGPASIVAWAGLLVVSGLIAAVFAMLGPAAGGVAGHVRSGLGERAGRAVGWCFLAGIVCGAPVVCRLGAGYLAALLGVGPALPGGILLLVVLAVTLRGVHASTLVQLVLVGVLIGVVVVAILGAAGHTSAANWTPFAPHGWPAIGAAAVVLMLSFVGWEAIAPLTDRFADPRRQLPRVIGIAFAITAVVYLALAAVTIGTGTTTDVPFATLLTFALGPAGPVVAAISALVLTVGTANAYLTGAAALTGSRWFHLPVAGVGAAELLGRVPTAGAIGVAMAFFLVVYVGCMAAAVRLLRGVGRVVAAVAGLAVVVVLAFSGYAVLPALALVLIGLLAPGAKRPQADRGSRRARPHHPRAEAGDRRLLR